MLATQGKQMEPQFNWISGTESFSVSCLITLDHIRNNDPRLFLSLWWHKEATEGDLEEEGGKGATLYTVRQSKLVPISGKRNLRLEEGKKYMDY